jgi:hypothetical protein
LIFWFVNYYFLLIIVVGKLDQCHNEKVTKEMKTPKRLCIKDIPHNDLYIANLFDNLSTKYVLNKVLPYTTIPKDDNIVLGETQSIVVSIVFTCHPQFHISFRYLDVGDTSCLDLAC